MRFEIERKFLLKNDGWKAAVVSSRSLSDGLLSNFNGNKVRVRTEDKKGSVTIKGPKTGLSRAELEYEIPLAEAQYMLSNLCGADVCSKTRYLVSYGMHIWHVDIYDGTLKGFRIAEIELAELNESFSLPEWIGQEVTENPSFGKWATLARYTAMMDTERSSVVNMADLEIT